MNRFKGKKILCFGDSITGNYSYPDDYPTYLEEFLEATVINMGFGGAHMGLHALENWGAFSMHKIADSVALGDFSYQEERTYDTVDYFPQKVQLLKNINFNEIDYITIFYGTNDWSRKLDSDFKMDVSTLKGATRYSIAKLFEAYPHIRIMLVTPMYRYFPEEPGCPDGEHFKRGDYPLSKVVQAILEVGFEFKIPVANLYDDLGINEYNRSYYFDEPDGTHPNSKGRRLLATRLAGEFISKF